jgi:polysaccharide pyruvyl transferase WcaK-like protein
VNQDDRQMARLIYDYFGESERFDILDIDRMNYCQIRYAISKCQAFIGARTHAVISAYSMCVPTIALGYSIKSRGIAKDLELDERLVVNSKTFAESDLLGSFQYLMENLDEIRNHLHEVMPEYCQRPYQIRKYLNDLY